MVKLVDLWTGRLDAMFWLPRGQAYRMNDVPQSMYRLIWAKNVRQDKDGEVLSDDFRQIQEINMTKFGHRRIIRIKKDSGVPADSELWNKFYLPSR